MGKRGEDITGQKFHRLTAISPAGSWSYWLFRCACGNEKVIHKGSVLRENRPTKSCGCVLKERIAYLTELWSSPDSPAYSVRHGHARVKQFTPEYQAWVNMRNRCYKTTDKRYHVYGGRGVAVCERWRSPASFENFVDDMGLKPSRELSLDRINNDGNYSCGKCGECLTNGWPANCRWATSKEQYSNRTTNRHVSFNGETHTVTEWAKLTGLSAFSIGWRLDRGWSVEKSLTFPQRVTAPPKPKGGTHA